MLRVGHSQHSLQPQFVRVPLVHVHQSKGHGAPAALLERRKQASSSPFIRLTGFSSTRVLELQVP